MPHRPEPQRYPCAETFVVGPFLFECVGHVYDPEDQANVAYRHHNGMIAHHSTSPGMEGDCELTWFTEASRNA